MATCTRPLPLRSLEPSHCRSPEKRRLWIDEFFWLELTLLGDISSKLLGRFDSRSSVG